LLSHRLPPIVPSSSLWRSYSRHHLHFALSRRSATCSQRPRLYCCRRELEYAPTRLQGPTQPSLSSSASLVRISTLPTLRSERLNTCIQGASNLLRATLFIAGKRLIRNFLTSLCNTLSRHTGAFELDTVRLWSAPSGPVRIATTVSCEHNHRSTDRHYRHSPQAQRIKHRALRLLYILSHRTIQSN